MKLKTMVFAALAALCMTTVAEAALVSRLGGKAIYDTEANLTWLQDMNYAKTTGYVDLPSGSVNGLFGWYPAMAWAESLNIEGVTGWRLPGGPMARGYNQTASEMGNLWYNVWGRVPGTTTRNASYNLFSNDQNNYYWSSVIENGEPWSFEFGVGFQSKSSTGSRFFAWAVHDGDVGASPVPVPAGAFLLAPAIAGLGFMRNRMQKL